MTLCIIQPAGIDLLHAIENSFAIPATNGQMQEQ